MDKSIEGDRGSDRLLKVASVLVNDFSLTDGAAFDLLLNEFNPRCVPPWEEHDIRRKIDEAKKNVPDRPQKGDGQKWRDETTIPCVVRNEVLAGLMF